MEDISILAIETSCDETAAAVVKNGRDVVSQALYTQIEIHKEYGGVVPEIASRNHVKSFRMLWKPLRMMREDLSRSMRSRSRTGRAL